MLLHQIKLRHRLLDSLRTTAKKIFFSLFRNWPRSVVIGRKIEHVTLTYKLLWENLQPHSAGPIADTVGLEKLAPGFSSSAKGQLLHNRVLIQLIFVTHDSISRPKQHNLTVHAAHRPAICHRSVCQGRLHFHHYRWNPLINSPEFLTNFSRITRKISLFLR